MTAIAHHPHRVARAVAGVRAELAGVADAPVWSMDANETTETLVEIQRAEAQMAELKSRVLVHADAMELRTPTGAVSTANWLAHRTRTTHRDAHRTMRLATGLDSRELTRTALAEGRLHLE